MYQHSSVPAGCVLSSSSASSDHLALVAFLSPKPLRRLRLSIGAKKPANGACSPGVAMLVGVSLSNVVNVPPQVAGPAPELLPSPPTSCERLIAPRGVAR